MTRYALRLISSMMACLRAAAGPAPARQTLDHLRADLSHEMAAKLARLAGFTREWREGRFRDDDARDARAIIADIRRLHLRHARVAAGGLGTFRQLVRVVATMASLQRLSTDMTGGRRTGAKAVMRIEQELGLLVSRSRALVEALSARYGARFGELVGSAAEEIRREAEAAGADGVPVVIDSADGGAAAWVPRADAARWSDLLRNIMRNAVQATEERADAARPAVVVRLRPAPGKGGACVEVIDEGVGMTLPQVDAMWRDGGSRHGDGHGQGLTAAKRAFCEERAALEVRSVPGVGTCVRLELPPRDVAFRPPHRLLALPLVLPAATLLLAAVIIALQLVRAPMENIRITDDYLVAALDGRGHLLWQRAMEDRVRPNFRSQIHTESPYLGAVAPPLIIPDAAGRPLAILATAPNQGPGRLGAYDGEGKERWSQLLSWTPPRVRHTGKLISPFQAATIWNDGARPAFVINVRDDNWASTSIQFLDADGARLGEYLHPGTLEFVASGDIDGDGRVEVLLNGKNNDARRSPAFWGGPALPEDTMIECLVLLETPNVNGQAFPHGRWDDVAPAREEAYLLIPPLRDTLFAARDTTAITRLPMGVPDAHGDVRMEAFLRDGRIYRLDGRLRPVSCGVGDKTGAAELAPTRAAAPLLYFHDGKMESLDIPVERGS